MRATWRWLVPLVWLGLAGAPTVRAENTATLPPAVHVESFRSGGKVIHVEVYEPDVPGPHRSILVLHGAGGMFGDGAAMRAMARRLARDRNRAYVVHYFDGSGLWFTGDDDVLLDHFDAWQAIVRDAVAWVHAREAAADPPIKPRVGIFGYSMGAFTGLAAASDNPRVGAVVAQSGGVWVNRFDRYGRLPPLLIIHGLKDGRVPFKLYIPPLLRCLKQRGVPVETRFYPNDGHIFHRASLAEVRELAADFLARRLPLSTKKRRPAQENPSAQRAGKRIHPAQ